MSQSIAYTRYRAEADFAFSRLKVSRETGDAARAEHWHQAWSRAEVAAEAEAREPGGGARVVRLKNPVPLRPLPEGVPPLALPLQLSETIAASTLPESEAPANPAKSTREAETPALEKDAVLPPPDAALQRAMQRHAVIDGALRGGGPNPFPEEMSEGLWQYHLTAFRVGGPCECELLQQEEEAVEAIVEFLPEAAEPGEELRSCPIASATEADSVEEMRTGENVSPGESSKMKVRDGFNASTDDVLSTRQRKTIYGANVRRVVGRNPLPQPSKEVVEASAPRPKGEHTTAPAWIDAAGRTRTWSLLDPSGEKLAEIATKRDAEKMAALLNRLVSHPAATSS